MNRLKNQLLTNTFHDDGGDGKLEKLEILIKLNVSSWVNEVVMVIFCPLFWVVKSH